MNFVFRVDGLLSNMHVFFSLFFSFSFICLNLPLYTQLTTEFFGGMMGEDVTPKDFHCGPRRQRGKRVYNVGG